MKLPLLGLFLLLSAGSCLAQMTTGLTGVRDTSFSNAGAYRQAKKKNPEIKLVEEFKLPSVQEKRNLVYCQVGDRKLALDAFYPKKKTKTKTPAILLIHGGGWRSGNREQHIPLAQRLADLGYACFTVEYRLSTEALYPAAILDLKSAVRWLRTNARQFNLDTAKITALGFSAGGELAAFLGTTNEKPEFEGANCRSAVSSQVQAVVDIDGTLSFVHPESGEGNDTKGTSAATYWFGYPKKENFALWEEASPLTHVGKTTPPFLFINSAVDRMHAGRGDFRKVLDQHRIYSEVHTFPNTPHTFPLFHPWFEPMVAHINAFLKKIYQIKR
ncbi:alpha/beta hydrolase fold domain-containing protein [Rufibacter sediminis]|uniref:Alpha/beta hydrolase n=1 Tax=Rufibacter sediminis TaxID=2762756 RepID=A0ABR6VVH7_9BACT|nr:alpha/beta hydrolase [Rufibacter sediminis]MBC3541166.1 alpha/beta hydrolase [Rufibacter sediminis]